MKNILIIESKRDISESVIVFIEDISEVSNNDFKNAIIECINKNSTEIKKDPDRNQETIQIINNMIYSHGYGYYFSTEIKKRSLPYNVEYIINHIIE